MTGHCLRNWLFLTLPIWAALAESNLRAQPKKPALTREQQEKQAALLVEFRKVKAAPEKRVALLDRAADLGPRSLYGCLEIIVKELAKPLGDYRQQFMKAAGQAVAKRSTTDKLQEIAELRAKVLTLAKQEDLTKEQIVSVDDLALKRLKEIIIFDRAEVLKQSPDLAKKRQALFPQGEVWQQCIVQLAKIQAESDDSKAKGPKGESEAATTISFEDYLVKEEEIASALAMPMDASTRSVLAANAQLASKLEPEEARCVLDLNLTRNLLGLAPLQIDLALTAAARDHSSDMESLNFFSHESPVAGKTTPSDRAQRAGTSASGENIAAGTLDGTVANKLWWHSPGHHKNMLGDHARVGVGRSNKHWTEMFGR